jgi:hypothetical protein
MLMPQQLMLMPQQLVLVPHQFMHQLYKYHMFNIM